MCVCVCVCLCVCYHDNSKLRASILTKLGLGSVGKGSDHFLLVKFWPSCANGKGVCGGRKLLAPPYYSQRAVFASPLSVFYTLSWSFRRILYLHYCHAFGVINDDYDDDNDRLLYRLYCRPMYTAGRHCCSDHGGRPLSTCLHYRGECALLSQGTSSEPTINCLGHVPEINDLCRTMSL